MLNNRKPSKKIGIVGGGQLGKMMIAQASKMGVKSVVLDPDPNCPAGSLAHEVIAARFDDRDALLHLASQTDVLTCEFEHISISALRFLEAKGYTVYPSADILEVIQNKYLQKMVLRSRDIPVGDYLMIEGISDLQSAARKFGYPLMLKTARGSYDGKGNWLIHSFEDAEHLLSLWGDAAPELYVEKFIPFSKEISVLCCGDVDRNVVTYPIAENIHRESILRETSVPAQLTEDQANRALEIAHQVYAVLGSAGILCVEMFVTREGDILVNEVAPRPHNSGHYTIEGCMTSQFENHVRAIIGLPLGKTDLMMPTVMRNLLGEECCEGIPVISGIRKALAVEGLSLHIYGKQETKPNRKMGHLTVIAPTLEDAKAKAAGAGKVLRIVSKNLKGE